MNYNLDCIAGYATEKAELARLCEIFNNREKYENKGAKLPKGIIFYGEAGTGKTLFAKVLASVCNLKVFKIDLGDVENESVICRHIKKTFVKAAKGKEPSMIFFDEVDKVLPNDGERYHTDRSKTILTQLLTLIDGMDSVNNIVFVATCNDYGALPETLTRPGRLDKKIGIGIPMYASRVEILEMYTKKSSCRFEMSIEDIAKLCTGFSCAALKTLVNECILQSDENGEISEELIQTRILEIKNEDIVRETSVVEDTICAARNIGAFVVARTFDTGHYILNLEKDSVCNDYFNSIISNFDYDYDDEDDYDENYEEDEECDDEYVSSNRYYNKTDLLNSITVLLGSYVAQELILHKIYSNVSSSLYLVDQILFEMARCGMLGFELHYTSYRHEELPYPAERLDALNRAMEEIKQQCYENARNILAKNEAVARKLIAYVVNKQTVQAEECERLLSEWGGIQK